MTAMMGYVEIYCCLFYLFIFSFITTLLEAKNPEEPERTWDGLGIQGG